MKKNNTKDLLICIDKKVAVIHNTVTNLKEQSDEIREDNKQIKSRLERGTGKIATLRESVSRIWWVISGILLVLITKIIFG